MKIALFDYGAGNLHSLGKALEAGGASLTVTGNWKDALSLDALVLPGVGAFGAAVRSLGPEALRVRESLEAGLPCLGICLGMQLLFHKSDEGEGDGIGFIPGSVSRLRTAIVPQMGWNDVNTCPNVPCGASTPRPDLPGAGPDPLFAGLDGLVAYYANSYVCRPSDDHAVIATSTYQGDTFPAAVRKKNTWGVQFHPEKSSAPGLQVISNFLREAMP
jgi:imidazole glycerol-phosphate synthase subunit HisH